jgi:hypothetical protein
MQFWVLKSGVRMKDVLGLLYVGGASNVLVDANSSKTLWRP